MEPVEALAQVVVISAILSKVIERVRVRFPDFDGDLVTLVAWVIGGLIAWGGGLDVSEAVTGTAIIEPINWIVSGLAIGLGAGIVSDLVGWSDVDTSSTVLVVDEDSTYSFRRAADLKEPEEYHES